MSVGSEVEGDDSRLARLYKGTRRWIALNTFAPAWLSVRWQHPLLGYGAAAVIQLATLLVERPIVRAVPIFRFPSAAPILVIVLVSVTWGSGPGIVATLVGAGLLSVIFPPSQSTASLGIATDVTSFLLFLVIGLAASAVGGQRERLRREAQALARALGEERARLDTIIEAVPDLVSIHDAQGTIVRRNRAAQAFRPDAVGNELVADMTRVYHLRTPSGALFPVEDLPIARAVRGEAVAPVEMQTIDGVGRERNLLVNVAPFNDAQGGVAGFVAVTHDVTELRQAQQAAAARAGALQAIIDALVEALVAGEGATEKTEVVAQRLVELTCRVLGCARVSITLHDATTGTVQPLAVVGVRPEEEQAWRSGRPGSALREYLDTAWFERLFAEDILIIDAANVFSRPLPYGIQTLLLAVMRVSEHVVGILSLDHGSMPHSYTEDEVSLARAVARLSALIIERDRLVRERKEARTAELALREANQRMDEFLSIASHELRSPLTGIQGMLELLHRRISREAVANNGVLMLGQMPEMVDVALAQTRRLERLIGDLLDASRIQSGHLALHRAACDLTVVIRDSVREQMAMWPARRLVLETTGETIPVQVDADRVRQVVTNYLTNALKYSPPDRPVTASVHTEGTRACVRVRDDGPGLTLEQQQHIWERYRRVPGVTVQDSSHAASGGLGLGLYISRTIIEQHGGHVGVESTPGDGAVFWFTLPLASPTGQVAGATTATGGASHSPDDLPLP